MDIANMYDLIKMISILDETTSNGNNHYVEDWCFNSDGKSIWVHLSNGDEFTFSV